jgi:mannose-6-phosphate isomerase-like protein (cupin superfamily)
MNTNIAEHPARVLRDPMDKGPYQMEIRALSPAQMHQRVARFDELKYPPDRYPDSKLPGRERKNYLVVGKGLQVAGAKDPMSAIPISEGFQLSYAKVRPGNGPQLHNHDSNETFIAIKGTWRVVWGLDQANSVDLRPLDVCSVPAFVPRTFVCLSAENSEDEGVIMAVIAGDAPNSEFN